MDEVWWQGLPYWVSDLWGLMLEILTIEFDEKRGKNKNADEDIKEPS